MYTGAAVPVPVPAQLYYQVAAVRPYSCTYISYQLPRGSYYQLQLKRACSCRTGIQLYARGWPTTLCCSTHGHPTCFSISGRAQRYCRQPYRCVSHHRQPTRRASGGRARRASPGEGGDDGEGDGGGEGEGELARVGGPLGMRDG